MAKAFDDQVNERLRQIARRVKKENFGDLQWRLAERLGISSSFLSELLNGNRGFGLETLIALAPFAPLEILDILRIDPSVVGALLAGAQEEKGSGIELLPDVVRRAARACIELSGAMPADVCASALDVYARFGDLPNTTPDWWCAQIRDHLAKPQQLPAATSSKPLQSRKTS